MLNTGIVGHHNHSAYLEELNTSQKLAVSGIFDPSFQFESPKEIPQQLIFTSFSELLKVSEAIIFASPDNTYFPLIELAVKQSKPVFLHSTYYLNEEELQHLITLQDEAQSLIQVYHPFYMHDAFIEYRQLGKTPLLIDCHYGGMNEKNLLPTVRHQVSAILSLFTKQVKRVTANTISSFSEVPDIISLRLDFFNGSIANILVNSIEKKEQHTIRLFEYNSHYLIDFSNHKLTCSDSVNDFNTQLGMQNNQKQVIIKKQLNDFYENVINHTLPKINLENEYNAFRVMEKVKEKMRVCINIV